MSQLGFWDWEKRHRYLEEKQDILVQLNQWIPWEEFREILHPGPFHSHEDSNVLGFQAISSLYRVS